MTRETCLWHKAFSRTIDKNIIIEHRCYNNGYWVKCNCSDCKRYKIKKR